jgi:flagellar protein FlaG
MSMQVNSRAAAPPFAAGAGTVAPRDAAPAEHAAPRLEPVRLPPPAKAEVNFHPEELRRHLQEAVSRLNEQMQRTSRDLSFSIDDRINRTIITVKNLQTGEVVRQIPTEEVVRLAHSIEDMKGVLFNKML